MLVAVGRDKAVHMLDIKLGGHYVMAEELPLGHGNVKNPLM
jgi:hypothetical protein